MLIDPIPGEVTPVDADRMIIRGASIWSSRWDHHQHAAAVRREGAKRSKGWDHPGLRLSLSLPCNVGRSVVE
jgi:hypothetical protein